MHNLCKHISFVILYELIYKFNLIFSCLYPQVMNKCRWFIFFLNEGWNLILRIIVNLLHLLDLNLANNYSKTYFPRKILLFNHLVQYFLLYHDISCGKLKKEKGAEVWVNLYRLVDYEHVHIYKVLFCWFLLLVSFCFNLCFLFSAIIRTMYK